MSDVTDAVRDAFEHTDYDLGDVSVNRSMVRVPVLQEGADPDALRAIVEEALGADEIRTSDVTTETLDADDTVGTVVTVRRR